MKIIDFLMNGYTKYMSRVKIARTYVKAIENNMCNYKNEDHIIESMSVGSPLYRIVSFGSRDSHIINIMGHENNDYPPFVKKEDFMNVDIDIFTIYIPIDKYTKYTYFQKINCMGKLYQMLLHIQ